MLQTITKIILFLFLFPLAVQGQQTKFFEKLEGCSVLAPAMSIEQAQEKAITNLKLEAFQRAGIGEELTSNSYYEQKQSSTQNKDKYFESSFSEIKGEITFFKLIDFSQKIGENNEIVICAQAQLEVVAFEGKTSNKAIISLEGLSQNYKNNSPLSVSISANKAHYFWVFLIDKNENYMLLYPRNKSESHQLATSDDFKLPISVEEQWVLQTDLSEEKNSLLIVSAQEKGAKPEQLCDFNIWSLWYKSLPFNSRKKQVYNFLIYN